MNHLSELIAWGKAHWLDLVQLWLSIVGLASVIVRLTPTLADDHWLKGVIEFVAKYVSLEKYGPSPAEQAKANRA